MFIIAVMAIMLGIMTLSEKLWGNPIAYIGAGYLAFCIALLGGVVLKAIGIAG